MENTGGPSANLTWAELACNDGTPYPLEWRADRAVELAAAFEAVRRHFGGPLIVDSAYRTEAYNRSLPIPGARFSQHVQGRALDLRPPKRGRLALKALISAARRAAGEGLVRGIGVYSGFVHIDTRPGTRVFTWYGSRSTNKGKP